MEAPGRGGVGLWWWVVWVLWCVPAGALEGGVLIAALAAAGERRSGSRGSTWVLVGSGAAWTLASTAGGLLYEYWNSFDVAARQNPIKDATGAYLEGASVAENVAFEVASAALVVPILYGIPTGLALFKIWRISLRQV